MKSSPVLVSLLLLCACDQPQQSGINDNQAASPPASAPVSPPRAAPPAPASRVPAPSLPDDRRPLEEPKGTIDPKSAEAAGQVVQHYAALIEQKHFADAAAHWGDQASAASFSSKLRANSENHLEIGKPGNMEGAAGSSYVTVPVVFYGVDAGGTSYRRAADVLLRRVNDVPGSTAAQRRWHIERIDWN